MPTAKTIEMTKQTNPARFDTSAGVVFDKKKSLLTWQKQVLPSSYFSAVHR